MGNLIGIWGHPYIDLEPFLDTSVFPELHKEICYSLARIEPWYTGGSLKWMNIVAPSFDRDAYVDYMRLIPTFTQEQFEEFVSLADEPARYDVNRYREYEFGDETDHPLSRAQILFLKYRYGVYFPWKVAHEFLANFFWSDLHSGAGKVFNPESIERFPKLIDYVKHLPFREIGRGIIFGLEANDHAPLHRDTPPDRNAEILHSITFCPSGSGKKRFYLSDPDEESEVPVETGAYWFNDMDYHGVHPAPQFQYSVRIDGVFDPAFLASLERSLRPGDRGVPVRGRADSGSGA